MTKGFELADISDIPMNIAIEEFKLNLLHQFGMVSYIKVVTEVYCIGWTE